MKRLVAAMALTTMLAACAGGPQPVTTIDHPMPDGKSRLTITRSTDLMYFGVNARVDVNGRRIGEISRGGSVQTVVEPGHVTISTDAWSAPGRFTIALNAQPNTEYLIQVSPRADGAFAGAFLGVGGQAIEGGGPFQIVVKDARRH